MVLVCHKHEFIFLKTSKTAGTSVELLLEPYCARPGHRVTEKTPTLISKYGVVGRRLSEKRKPDFIFRESNKWYNHMPARKVAKLLGPDKWKRYRKITIIRNPFDQAVSRFYWANQLAPIVKAPMEERKRAFNTFIKQKDLSTDTKVAFFKKKYIIDFIIRFENMRADLEAVSENLGISIDTNQLPHTKSQASLRKSDDVARFFGPEETDIILDKMSWVFDHGGYSHDPIGAQE